MKTISRRFFIFALAIALSVAFSPLASATPITGNVVVGISATDTVTQQSAQDQFNIPIDKDGNFNVSDVPSESTLWDGALDHAWGNADPFTNLAFSITNITPNPVEYIFSITIPIAPPMPGSTVHGGSTAGSVTDANNNGLGGLSNITSVPGTPFYQGQIDGSTVLSIYPAPFAFSFAFAGQTVSIPALNPGLPGPTLPSGGALATIGIMHRFTLSAGDSMSATSFFVVEVPEPSSIALASFGVVGLAWAIIRRRRG